MATRISGAITGGTVWNQLRALGPALVLAAVVVGPGSIALSTIAGSTYGYQLLWVPIATTVFMITYTWMAARIGLVTGETILQVARRRYGSAVATAGGFFGFLAILAFQAGNNAGIGFATNALVGYDIRLWAAIFSLAAIGFLWLPDLYNKVELLVKAVVGVMLLAFVGTLATVGFDIRAGATGIVPTIPDVDAALLALGMAATTFSIAAATYQSYLVHEKDWGIDQLSEKGMDSILGIAVLGLIVTVILLTSASVISGTGEPAFSATDMATQLEPVAGSGAFYLFTFGFFFASLSSLVVNALIGATLLVDGLGLDPSMDGRPVKIWSTVAVVFGLVVVLVFEGDPVELLRIAQAAAVVAFPILGFLILALASSDDVMGSHSNGRFATVLGVVGYLAIVGIVGNYLYEIVSELVQYL
ncbi:Nramp family divalent metal transporter [Natrialba aegyptia]|uniref:Natural resistance-associated macrophage protein n=1 Tax=Natrialba aegyptia DSM 13077 TaxID=1227491 RepID=M0AK99_9EURY|nr:Nramp family divalent metal transporter [Natrialba aegyptia]ELY98342.1 natural resistance-associated macrophage protein [Natrialba aegyptia DSM 13077]